MGRWSGTELTLKGDFGGDNNLHCLHRFIKLNCQMRSTVASTVKKVLSGFFFDYGQQKHKPSMKAAVKYRPTGYIQARS